MAITGPTRHVRQCCQVPTRAGHQIGGIVHSIELANVRFEGSRTASGTWGA